MRAHSVATMRPGALVGARPASNELLRLATLALAQAFDLATFVVMVGRHGAGAEANPFVNDLFGAYGMAAVVFAKLALVLLDRRPLRGLVGTGQPWRLVDHRGPSARPRDRAGLIGGITNAATLLR